MKQFELSNLHKETKGEWSYLICDFSVEGMDSPFEEKTMWFAVKKEYESMLSDETYDAFFLVPLYLGMFYGAKVKISGKVSKKLYRNMMEYGQQILKNFSSDLDFTEVETNGLTEKVYSERNLIGTGISCGVDSLSTIYDRYEKENDIEYRLNSLFIFNCGTHGDYENPETQKRFINRYELNRKAASDMNLLAYQVNSNLHAFTHKIAEQKLGYFAIYSCVLSMEKVIKKYYLASSYSYDELLEFHDQSHDFDMAEYTESYLVPLIQTESTELILDGAQYKRSQKTENIADWDIAKNHLNVCINPHNGAENCSCCSKCMRTLLPLDAMGKLNEFSNVFDLDVYKKNSHKNKIMILASYHKEGFATDNVDFLNQYGVKMPSKFEVIIYKTVYAAKVIGRHILGNRIYDGVKRIIQH
jgi:hypothetical protein